MAAMLGVSPPWTNEEETLERRERKTGEEEERRKNQGRNQTPKFPSMRKRVLHPPDLGIHQPHDQISPCTILVGPFFFPLGDPGRRSVV